MLYISQLKIIENPKDITLEMSFKGYGTSFIIKIMSKLFGVIMKKSMKRALEIDLKDIKNACEA